MNSRPSGIERKLVERVRDHVRVEMASLAGVDLHGAHTGRADALGVARGLLVALDHGDREPALEVVDRAHQERGFPDPGLETKLSASVCRPARYARLLFA